jgi:hypothetical protein
MATVIDLTKRFNHRWKTDRNFVEGFDYATVETFYEPSPLSKFPSHPAPSKGNQS